MCYLIHKEITRNYAGKILEIIRNPVVLNIKFSVEQNNRSYIHTYLYHD